MALKLGVIASGGGSNLQSIIDACEAGRLDAEVAVVLSDNPEAFALERGRRAGAAIEVVELDREFKEGRYHDGKSAVVQVAARKAD